jgi:hypothetical protein
MSFSKLAAVAALTLAACSTADEANNTAAPMATELAPPPGAGGLRLVVDGVLQPGNTVRFLVTGAQPGQNVFLARGTAELPGALCPPALSGLCVDLDRATLLTTLTANGQGRAQFQATVPRLAEGLEVYFQAATGGATAATSNVVGKWNPKDTGAIMALDLLEEAVVSPGSYVGTRSEIYYSIINGLDVCWIEADTSGTGLGPLPACTGCDFAFALTLENFRDVSVSGDCIDLLAFDPSTIAPTQQGWGYDSDYYFAGYGNYPVAMFFDTATTTWNPASLYVSFTAGDFAWLIPQVNYFWY